MSELDPIKVIEPTKHDINDYSYIEDRNKDMVIPATSEHSDTPEQVLAKYRPPVKLPEGTIVVYGTQELPPVEQ